MPFSPNPQIVYADGPVGDPHEPPKDQIRQIWAQAEAAIDAYSSGAGSIAKQTLVQLNADLAHDADVMAWVYNDPVVANNGIYRKSGASGAGSWTRILNLPFPFIPASDVGAGTPNAIQATSSLPISDTSLVWMNIADTNTASPVTVQFNGTGPVYTIKTNSGNDIAPGGLVAGMIVLGVVSGATFRLLSDQASASVVAAAEAAQVAAEAAQAAALAAANAGYLFDTKTDAEGSSIAGVIGLLQLAGEEQIGDFGHALYREITEDGGTLYPSQFKTNVNTRRWENAEPFLDCAAYFGVRSGASPSVVRDGINDAISESARLLRPARLPPATVTINARLFAFSGASLIGLGRQFSVIALADGSNVNMMEGSADNNMTLRSFAFDGNRANQIDGNGVIFDTCSGLDISDVEFRNILENGILLRDCVASRVVNNRLILCGKEEIVGMETHASHAISVAYNTVVGTPRDLLVSGNYTEDPYGSGVNLSGTFGCVASGNIVVQTGLNDYHPGYAGVRLTNGAEGNVVTANQVRGHGRGLFVASTAGRGNELIGNRIRAAGQEGILVQASGTLVQGNKINGVGLLKDTLSLTGIAGIKVNETPTGVQVIGNEVIDSGTGMDYAIHFNTSTSRQVIKDNVLEGFQVVPILTSTHLIKAGGNIWPGYDTAIAAAATLALPVDADIVTISGSGTITDITGGYYGCKITLRVPTGVTITDGGNLRLAGDMTGATGRTITLTKTSSVTWEEVSRSLN